MSFTKRIFGHQKHHELTKRVFNHQKYRRSQRECSMVPCAALRPNGRHISRDRQVPMGRQGPRSH